MKNSSNENKTNSNNPTKPGKELIVYRTLLGISVIIILVLSWLHFGRFFVDSNEPPGSENKPSLPHYEFVMQLINRLSYSGFKTLVRPDVDLSINFEKKLWALNNMHRLDPKGHVLLEEDRYGLCGQLADYVSRQIKPVFGNGYHFSFDRVAEIGYFLNPKSTHFVIRIQPIASPDVVFIIDPSLRRYGPEEDFDNYSFFDRIPSLSFPRDAVFEIPSSTPIMIKRDFIVHLGVETADDHFDKQNFTIALLATKQYRFSGRFIFAMRMRNGEIQQFENQPLAQWLMENKDYKTLRRRIVEWFYKNVRAAQPDLDPTKIEKLRDLAKKVGAVLPN